MKYFEGQDFSSKTEIYAGEYENCTFKGCMLAEQNLKDYKFIDCEFIDSDLSNINTGNTSFQNVLFQGCKMLGIRFDYCNSFLLSVKFENCQLNFSSYYALSLENFQATDCDLSEVDFTDSCLAKSCFINCKLNGATFDNCDLRNSDFSSASGYSIDPEKNKIQGCKFSFMGLPGLLDKYQIEIV
ncbi:pentapeptide repeat-containing protein [Mangrovivirga sp. M17]|uniref:Pentapeptide repeat-containing protein n=1 Tax=Mangrovivirga halotolerans TaxID=2993936 RepID=A0ABT3RNP7_9BACT|nr:pentapeptide repeat-containing protein [Mangrovivirga halotolerans]MCX2742989.1 pentapeptide repeat-containing protein [Mangrovivirga halotolerans]